MSFTILFMLAILQEYNRFEMLSLLVYTEVSFYPIFYCLIFWDRASLCIIHLPWNLLCSPGLTWTHGKLPASTPRVLGLKACAPLVPCLKSLTDGKDSYSQRQPSLFRIAFDFWSSFICGAKMFWLWASQRAHQVKPLPTKPDDLVFFSLESTD